MNHKPYIRNLTIAKAGVLLIHGIISTPRHFDFIIPHIPDEFAVHNILLPGHGGTVKDFSKATVKQWHGEVQKALSELEAVCDKIYIIGYSLGALLALDEMQGREKIAGIMLLNPPLLPQLKPSMMWRSIRFSFGQVRKDDYADALCFEDLSVTLEPYLWKYLGWFPNFVGLLTLARRCKRLPAGVKVPCYAFLGAKDEVVRLKTARYLEGNPLIVTEVFEEGLHFGYNDDEKKRILYALDRLLSA